MNNDVSKMRPKGLVTHITRVRSVLAYLASSGYAPRADFPHSIPKNRMLLLYSSEYTAEEAAKDAEELNPEEFFQCDCPSCQAHLNGGSSIAVARGGMVAVQLLTARPLGFDVMIPTLPAKEASA